jgi:hypothetical protein
MKILVARHCDWHNPFPQDYLCDQVFHGLHSLGYEVTDDSRSWYLYRGEFKPWGGTYNLDEGHYHGSPLYGGGFSYAATLDEDMTINRNRKVIEQRIESHYYDKIVIGRPDYIPSYIDLIYQHYDRKDILALDGRDETNIDWNLANRTTYFKRELDGEPTEFMRTISFAIPESKLRHERKDKSQYLGTVIPFQPHTYVFKVESEYYDDYARSLFAITRKKSGWDCMRHYEILANRCVPYFVDIEACPKNIMLTLNKDLLIEIKRTVDQHGVEYYAPNQPGWAQYCAWEEQLHREFVSKATTIQLAQHLLAE